MNDEDIERLEVQIAQAMETFEEMLEAVRDYIKLTIEAFNDAGLLDN